MIQIPFEITDGIYTLADALWLADDNILTEVEIEAMKQQRFDNFVTLITTPPIDEQVVI